MSNIEEEILTKDGGIKEEFIDSMMKLIELNEQILHQNKVFIHTLEENGIDVDKIDFNKDV